MKIDNAGIGLAVGYLGIRSLMQQRGGKSPVQLADLIVSAQIYIVVSKLRESFAQTEEIPPAPPATKPLAPYVGTSK